MKGFGGLNMNMLKQAQKMQEKIARMQEEVANKTCEATVGGGMVSVVANGKNEIISIKIAPEVVDPDDIDMLQDLVISAINEALRKTTALMAEEMQKVTKGLGLPPGLI